MRDFVTAVIYDGHCRCHSPRRAWCRVFAFALLLALMGLVAVSCKDDRSLWAVNDRAVGSVRFLGDQTIVGAFRYSDTENGIWAYDIGSENIDKTIAGPLLHIPRKIFGNELSGLIWRGHEANDEWGLYYYRLDTSGPTTRTVRLKRFGYGEKALESFHGIAGIIEGTDRFFSSYAKSDAEDKPVSTCYLWDVRSLDMVSELRVKEAIAAGTKAVQVTNPIQVSHCFGPDDGFFCGDRRVVPDAPGPRYPFFFLSIFSMEPFAETAQLPVNGHLVRFSWDKPTQSVVIVVRDYGPQYFRFLNVLVDAEQDSKFTLKELGVLKEAQVRDVEWRNGHIFWSKEGFLHIAKASGNSLEEWAKLPVNTAESESWDFTTSESGSFLLINKGRGRLRLFSAKWPEITHLRDVYVYGEP